ncbi:MAG: hypothetical protein NXI32_25025 [bacterium]|nr:hypothetical protein [bacterium]
MRRRDVLGIVLILEEIPSVGRELDYSNYALCDGKLCIPDEPGFGITRTPGAGIGPKHL